MILRDTAGRAASVRPVRPNHTADDAANPTDSDGEHPGWCIGGVIGFLLVPVYTYLDGGNPRCTNALVLLAFVGSGAVVGSGELVGAADGDGSAVGWSTPKTGAA